MKYIIYIFFLYALSFSQTADQLFQQALIKEQGEGNLQAAVMLYEKIVEDNVAASELRAKAQLHIGLCWEKMGKVEAIDAYRRVIRNFSHQKQIASEASSRLIILEQERNKNFQLKKITNSTVTVLTNLHRVSPNGRYLSGMHHATGDLLIIDLLENRQSRLTDNYKIEKELQTKSAATDQLEAFYQNMMCVYGSAWSFDASRIAFIWANLYKADTFRLRIFNISGKEEENFKIPGDYDWIGVEDWSHADKWILLQAHQKDGNHVFLIMDIQTKSIINEIELGEFSSSMAIFREDDKSIVYDIEKNDQSQKKIYVYNIENQITDPLVQHNADNQLLGIVPEKKRLLYCSDISGTLDIWSLEIQDTLMTSPNLVVRDIGQIKSLGFTREGIFHYGKERFSYDIYKARLNPNQNMILEKPAKITEQFVGSNALPQYSPDGSSLAFISNRLESQNRIVLCVQEIASGEISEHTLPFKSVDSITWSHLGPSLIVGGIRTPDQRGIYRYALDSRQIKNIFTFREPDAMSLWAADLIDSNKYIIQYRPNNQEVLTHLFVFDTVIQEQSMIYSEEKAWPLNITISRDRQYIYFRSFRNMKDVLCQIPAQGGEVQELYNLGDYYLASFDWLHENNMLLYVRGNFQSKERQLFRVLLKNLNPINLHLEIPFMSALSIHPNGQDFVFQAGQLNREIWAMQNYYMQ